MCLVADLIIWVQNTLTHASTAHDPRLPPQTHQPCVRACIHLSVCLSFLFISKSRHRVGTIKVSK